MAPRGYHCYGTSEISLFMKIDYVHDWNDGGRACEGI